MAGGVQGAITPQRASAGYDRGAGGFTMETLTKTDRQRITNATGYKRPPRNIKAAIAAIDQAFSAADQHVELNGYHGDTPRATVFTCMTNMLPDADVRSPKVAAAFDEVAGRFDWQLTRENAEQLRKAMHDLCAQVQADPIDWLDVEDNRREKAEHDKELAERKERMQKREAAKAQAEREAQAADPEAYAISKAYGAEQCKLLREAYKKRGWNMKAISVKNDSYSMGSSMYVTIKRPDIVRDFAEVERLANAGESVSRCEITGDILSGGNRFVDVKYSEEAETMLAACLLDDCAAAIAELEAELAKSVEEYGAHAQLSALFAIGETGYLIGYDSHNMYSVWRNDESGRVLGSYREHDQTVSARCLAKRIGLHLHEHGKHPLQLAPVEQPQAAPTKACSAYSIETHTHTKKQRDMVLVIPAERLDRDAFNELRDAAKAAGGWYSRAWSGVPGGFAWWLDDDGQNKAESFAAQAWPSEQAAPVVSEAKLDKLQSMADKLDEQAEDKLAPRREHTPRQQRQSMSARIDGHHMQRAASILRGWCNSDHALPAPTKAEAMTASSKRLDSSGYYHIAETEAWSHDDPRSVALRSLIGLKAEKTKEQKQAEALQELRSIDVPGFFPTPERGADLMVELAEIQEGELVLDPGAGTGALLEAAKRGAPECRLQAFEQHGKLAEYVRDYVTPATTCGDYLQLTERGLLPDVVLINPPYENDQGLLHVRHAVEHCKRRVVALLPVSVLDYGTARLARRRDWHAWLESQDYTTHEVDPGLFQGCDAFRKAGVATVIVVIECNN